MGSLNPFVGKRTNSSATYPYPFRYPWEPLLSLFVVTKDYYRISSPVFPLLCLSLDIFPRFSPFLRQKNSRLRLVFHLKMASAYIPFDEVLEYFTTDIPGEVFSDFRIKVKMIFQTTMRVGVIFMRKTTSLRALATVCVFLFVCLSNRFYQSIFASHVTSILFDMNIRIQWNLVTIFYHQMKMLSVIVAQYVTEPLIDEM